jgi:hypothetical protein
MIHHVFANKSNVGDWLSAVGIQSLLAPLEVREYMCDGPFVPSVIAALSRASEEDLIVIGGGDLFMDYFTPFWEGLLTIANRVPFCIWGVGYCDEKREPTCISGDLLADIIRRSQFTVVNDELSRSHLAHCPLPEPVACPSMNVISPQPSEFGLLHVDNYTTAGADVFEAMDASGREFARLTGRPYQRTNNRIPGGDQSALVDTLRKYTKSDLVLSSGLHGCVIALAMGRRVIAVSGDRKLESFMQAAGLSEWVLDISAVDRLKEYLPELPSQLPPNEFIAATIKNNRHIAAAVSKCAKNLSPRNGASIKEAGGS